MVVVISKRSVAAKLLLLVMLVHTLKITEAQIGVCYGRNGNNLPSEPDVVSLYKSRGIARMRLYDLDLNALQALRGSGIGLILDVPGNSLPSLGSDPSAANRWVQTNIVPYASDVNFRYLAVGNEIHPSDSVSQFVLPAMRNLQIALQSANLNNIKVSTSIDTTLITNSYPPSNGVFTSPSYINPIINFLNVNGSPLLVNVYPYFAYTGNPQQISLSYALFTSPGSVVYDQNSGLQYQNLFDAILDSAYAALEKAGAPNVVIVVSETGWPSASGNAATPQNAGTYYQNLVNHVKNGSPKRSGKAIETYMFAMFDENLKPAGSEQHFGLFSPDKTPKYQVSFS